MNQLKSKKVVLITGSSSGIGKATTDLFYKQGYKVYGTSRKAPPPGSNESSNPDNQMIYMDVTKDASVTAAVDYIIKDAGKLDILILNAGNGIAGSIECTDIDESKWQFETNFFGVHRVIRQVLPYMRSQKSGVIIAISSVAGVISIPYQAMYSASKYALEAMIEALRYEVQPFGIKACLVEPGDTKTNFTGNRHFSDATKLQNVYDTAFKRSIARMESDEQNGVSPDKVAKVIIAMASKKTPPARKAVGFSYQAIILLKKLMPAALVEFAISKMYG